MDTLSVILLLLAFSVVSVVVFRRFNLPPVLGYLLVGALIGPHAYNLIEKVDAVSHPAEFGVVFLMFSIGLEFSLPKLYSMKRIVFGLGLLQVLLTIGLVTLVVSFFHLSWQSGVALGGVLAMSSTAVLVKLLTERLELDSKHGRKVMGVLLFQDIAVVPLLILIPSFSETPERMAIMMGLAFLKAAAVLAFVLFAGQKIMRFWFNIITRSKSEEVFVLNVLLITLSLAWLTEYSGLSLALGAFLAGMLISETEFRHQVEDEIRPFRDVLLGLFFITIGMLLDMRLVIDNFFMVLCVLLALLFFKFILVAAITRLLISSPGTAIRTGLWLCAGGEFGFVLLAEIRRAHLLPSPVLQTVLAALVLSMLIAPFLVQYSDRLVMRFVSSEWMLRSMELTKTIAQTMNNEKHALICGFGRSGQYLARFMAQEGVSYAAIDMDPERVRDANAAGENVVYGNAAQREMLVSAGISRASVLIISFIGAHATERVLAHARELAPNLPVIVRTLEERDLDHLYKAGAAEAVPEILETSMMLASYAMIHLGVPINRVFRRIRQIRSERYRTLRGFYHGETDIDDSNEPRLHSISLSDDAYAIGKTLGQLGLGKCGVEVNAIRRRQILAHEPSEETILQDGDVIVLLGIPSALLAGEARLLKG